MSIKTERARVRNDGVEFERERRQQPSQFRARGDEHATKEKLGEFRTHLRATGAARMETRMDACIVLKEGSGRRG